MKKLLLIAALTIVNCNAMSAEEEQKNNIIKAIEILNNSAKEQCFFAFYDLFYYIQNVDKQPDEQIASIHKPLLEQLGLLENDQLKPMVKEVFTLYIKEKGMEKTLLLDNDIE